MSSSPQRRASRILWGLLAGVVMGFCLRLLAGDAAPEGGEKLWSHWLADQVFAPVGQVFLRLLFFVVIPLVFASLCMGVAQLGRLDKLGPLAGKTFALFGFNMAVGVALGLVFMNLAQPGKRISPEMRDQIVAEYQTDGARHQATAQAQRDAGFTLNTAVEMFLPRNLFGAVVGQSRGQLGDVLPLIAFAILVGAAGTTLAERRRQKLIEGLDLVGELMTKIVNWALALAPYAVACLIASVVIKFGVQFLLPLLYFTLGLIGVMALHLFGTLSVLLKLFTRVSPRKFFGAVKTILITAFSTSSSNATLPTSLAVTKEQLGVSPSVAGFVLPLGATMNMAGTALYEGCVVLFVAQVYGIDLALGQQVVLLLLSVLSAVAVAGIPGGSLPLIVGLLTSFGIPAEGIAMVLGVDRLLDMSRTTVNVAADVVTAVILNDSPAAPAENGETKTVS